MKILETRSVGPLGRLYLARLPGESRRLIEFVDTVEPGVEKARKWVLMLSTQVGCVIGCRMCDGGAMGWRGNLTAAEIVAQVRRVVKDNPGLEARRHPKFKVHFARLGEPTLNPATPRALEMLAAQWGGPGLTASISTVAPDAPTAAACLEEMRAVKDRLYRGDAFSCSSPRTQPTSPCAAGSCARGPGPRARGGLWPTLVARGRPQGDFELRAGTRPASRCAVGRADFRPGALPRQNHARQPDARRSRERVVSPLERTAARCRGGRREACARTDLR